MLTEMKKPKHRALISRPSEPSAVSSGRLGPGSLKTKAGIEVTSEETAGKKAAQRILAKLAVKVLIDQARQKL